jgi:hypothetical protein
MPVTSRRNTGTAHKKRILFALGSHPQILAYNAVSGVFFTLSGERVKVGQSGMADIMGSVCVHGLCLTFACEAKSGSGKLSQTQIRWKKNWEARGNIYLVAKDGDETTIANKLLSIAKHRVQEALLCLSHSKSQNN